MTQAVEVAIGTVAAACGLCLLVAAGLVWVIGQSLRHATRPRGPHTHLPGVTTTGTRKENQP